MLKLENNTLSYRQSNIILIIRAFVSFEDATKGFDAEEYVNKVLDKVFVYFGPKGYSLEFRYRNNRESKDKKASRFMLLTGREEVPKNATRIPELRSDNLKLFKLIET